MATDSVWKPNETIEKWLAGNAERANTDIGKTYLANKPKAPTPPPPPAPSIPTYTPPQYNQMSYETARKQAADQLNPSYQLALSQLQQQRFANEQSAGDLAAARGLGRSGLSADLQNKVNLSAMQQGSALSAQRASQEAQMAQALIDQDFSRQQSLRDMAFREYMGQNQLALGQSQFDWQKQMGQADLDYRNQQSKQQQEQYNRDYILRQLQAMANAGIDISKLQEDWLLKPWG